MSDTRSNFRQLKQGLGALAPLAVLLLITLFSTSASSQNRVDLEDLSIKGELLNDNRMRLSSRDQHQLNDRVSYRNNFRKEIVDGLEIQWPESEGERGPASETRPTK